MSGVCKYSTTGLVYLASEFGNPNGLAEGVVPVGDICNEILRMYIVPVDSHAIELDISFNTRSTGCGLGKRTVQPLHALKKFLIQTLPFGFEEVAGDINW